MSKLRNRKIGKTITLSRRVLVGFFTSVVFFSMFGCSDPPEENKFSEVGDVKVSGEEVGNEELQSSPNSNENLKSDFHFSFKGAYPGITLAELRKVPFELSNLSLGSFKEIKLSCQGDDFIYLEEFGIEAWQLPTSLTHKYPPSAYLSCFYTGVQTEKIYSQDKYWNGPIFHFVNVGFAGHPASKFNSLGKGEPENRIIYEFFPNEDQSEEEIKLAQIAVLMPNDWYEGIYEALVEKYGEPTVTETQIYENSFSREFNGKVSYWIGKEQTLVLKEYQENISQSYLLFIDKQLVSEAKKFAKEIEELKIKKDAEDF